MASRARSLGRRFFSNVHPRYQELLVRKKLPVIVQMATPVTRDPTYNELGAITEIEHIWKTGDRLSKLAHTYYGNSEYWWVIARYNQAPTEGHLKRGMLLYIPTPINRALEIL
jgi:nucleoid-associated protein YgaU